jgi:zinc transport system ATP-binding protein
MSDALAALSGVSFAYDGEPVLSSVDVRVDPGEFVALIGPNGSGKSTLLKILLGLLAPDAGTVELFGLPPARMRRRDLIGYVPQRPSLAAGLPATVAEIVATGMLARRPWWRRNADAEAVGHALEVVGLHALSGARASELSGGQQQRAFIARALVTRPQLLVLDEPIAGVDAESQARFREALVHHVREHQGSVLLVSHELSAVRGALHRVIVLRNTVRFDGTPEDLEQTMGLGEELPLRLEAL